MKKILLVLGCALLIRLVGLDQSLWLDEATTAKVAHHYSLGEIATVFLPNDFHPPLYYQLMKGWTAVFGYSEIALRLPSVLFSLFTGYLIFLIGKRAENETAGTWASIFFLFNPLVVYYSQEARMYMMATFFLTASLYFLLFRTASEKKVYPFLCALCIGLAFLTFYGSIFFIVPLFLFLLYKKRYTTLIISTVVMVSVIIFLSPLLLLQLSNAQKQLQIVAHWSNVLGKANIKNLGLIPLKFSIGRITFFPKWSYWLISGAWTLFVFAFVSKGGLKNRQLLLLFLIPILIATIFSLFSPLLQYFRFIYLIPVMSLLLAIGMTHADRSLVKFIVLAGFLVFSCSYLFIPGFHREDWKGLMRSLPAHSTIFMVKSSSDPAEYYGRDIKIKDLKELNVAQNHKEIIVIPYTADIYGIPYRHVLEDKHFSVKKSETFRNVIVEYWSRN